MASAPLAAPPLAEPPAAERAIPVGRAEFQARLDSMDPTKILDERVKPFRLHTSVPAIAVARLEFLIEGNGSNAP